MDAAAELGRNSVSKHQIQPEYGDEQAGAGRDCRTVTRDQILRRKRGQGHIPFPCSADYEQDWQPYPVDPILLLYVWPYIQTVPYGCRLFVCAGRTFKMPMSMITGPWKFPSINEADFTLAELDIDFIVDNLPSRHPPAPVLFSRAIYRYFFWKQVWCRVQRKACV